MTETAHPLCELCGNPMPPGEEMFKFHGYSGPCPETTPAALARRAEDERIAANMKINAEVQEACYNPAVQIRFRAGFLACREIMARFVEQGGDANTAASIRANWPPSLGADPGIPRQLRYDEVADEKEDHIAVKPIDPSVEALPFAYAFIVNPPSAALQQSAQSAKGECKI